MKTMSPEKISELVKRAHCQRLLPGELVYEVKHYAYRHYSEGGWSAVVECWSPEEILEVVGKCWTAKSAIKKMAAIVKAQHEYAQEIRSTAF